MAITLLSILNIVLVLTLGSLVRSAQQSADHWHRCYNDLTSVIPLYAMRRYNEMLGE